MCIHTKCAPSPGTMPEVKWGESPAHRTRGSTASRLAGHSAVDVHLGGGRARGIAFRSPFRHQHHPGRDEVKAGEGQPGEVTGIADLAANAPLPVGGLTRGPPFAL